MSGLLPPVRIAVGDLVAACEAAQISAYLVGGPVRDLLLGREPLDVDIVVEGDALRLALSLEGRPHVSRVVTHPRFGTATLRLPGANVDVITARSETYPHPGALPKVSPGTIFDDLSRRDFSINAIALPLVGPGRGVLLDPLGGRHDLEARLVRALHKRSFLDDATRILRGARYAARLGFEIEAATRNWMKQDARFLSAISSARIRRELVKILTEEAPEAAIRIADELGALKEIDPALGLQPATSGDSCFNDDVLRGLSRLRVVAKAVPELSEQAPPLAAAWAVLLWPVVRDLWPQRLRVYRRIALTGPEQAAVDAIPRGVAAVKSAWRGVRGREWISASVELEDLPEGTIWALAAMSTESDWIIAYLAGRKTLRPRLRGHDLIRLGVPRGPAIGEVLKELRIARITGRAPERVDEERIVEEFLLRSRQ